MVQLIVVKVIIYLGFCQFAVGAKRKSPIKYTTSNVYVDKKGVQLNGSSNTTAAVEFVTEKNIDTEYVKRYQAVLSYRRFNSRNLAMLLKVLLEREKIKTFIDVEDIGGGFWAPQIMTAIQQSPNFILILAKGTLDRCKNDTNYTDFMHKEIKEAVDAKRRIVLVFDEFDFPSPEEFSPEIQAAMRLQGLTWEHKLVDQSLERLISYMTLPRPLSSYRNIVKLHSRQKRFKQTSSSELSLEKV